MARKPSAAERTVGLFEAPPVEKAEPEERTVKDGERVSLEADVDRMRAKAFEAQEWTTANFGTPEAQGNTYRITKKGDVYYLEILSKGVRAQAAHGYTGIMVHAADLYNLATVIVSAVRAKQAAERGQDGPGA